jgi:hypothetical protein
LCRISVADGDIEEIPKVTHFKLVVADRLTRYQDLVWSRDLLSGNQFNVQRKMWRISVADGEMGKITKSD